MAQDELLKMTEVSERYAIPVQTLRCYRRDGRGPKSGRLAGHVVYRRSDVDAWVEAELAATTAGGLQTDAA